VFHPPDSAGLARQTVNKPNNKPNHSEEGRTMPTYDYRCETCGPFVLMRRVADRDAACACATCGAIAQRTLSVPGLALMSSTARAEHQVNERAGSTHQHGSGCGCGTSRVEPAGSLKTKAGAWRRS
jgi:putative FmdB family regulatory protein